jgi:hypothetical protein
MQPGTWAPVAALDPDAMFATMLERFEAVAALPEAQMFESLDDLARAESELEDDRMEMLIAARLRAWLELPRPAASALAACFDSACQSLPADSSARRAHLMRDVRRSMSPREIVALNAIHPSLAAQLPKVEPGHEPAAPPSRPRPRWQFWRRS